MARKVIDKKSLFTGKVAFVTKSSTPMVWVFDSMEEATHVGAVELGDPEGNGMMYQTLYGIGGFYPVIRNDVTLDDLYKEGVENAKKEFREVKH